MYLKHTRDISMSSSNDFPWKSGGGAFAKNLEKGKCLVTHSGDFSDNNLEVAKKESHLARICCEKKYSQVSQV